MKLATARRYVAFLHVCLQKTLEYKARCSLRKYDMIFDIKGGEYLECACSERLWVMILSIQVDFCQMTTREGGGGGGSKLLHIISR